MNQEQNRDKIKEYLKNYKTSFNQEEMWSNINPNKKRRQYLFLYWFSFIGLSVLALLYYNYNSLKIKPNQLNWMELIDNNGKTHNSSNQINISDSIKLNSNGDIIAKNVKVNSKIKGLLNSLNTNSITTNNHRNIDPDKTIDIITDSFTNPSVLEEIDKKYEILINYDSQPTTNSNYLHRFSKTINKGIIIPTKLNPVSNRNSRVTSIKLDVDLLTKENNPILTSSINVYTSLGSVRKITENIEKNISTKDLLSIKKEAEMPIEILGVSLTKNFKLSKTISIEGGLKYTQITERFLYNHSETTPIFDFQGFQYAIIKTYDYNYYNRYRSFDIIMRFGYTFDNYEIKITPKIGLAQSFYSKLSGKSIDTGLVIVELEDQVKIMKNRNLEFGVNLSYQLNNKIILHFYPNRTIGLKNLSTNTAYSLRFRSINLDFGVSIGL